MTTPNYNNVILSRIGDPIEEYATTANFPAVGKSYILYVATDTGQFYKWDGSFYYEHGPLGSATATHGDQHKSDNSDPIALTEYIVPEFTTNTNNLAHNNKNILYISADIDNRELSGIIAPTFCVIKLLVNTSSTNTIVLKNQSIDSDPSNRFLIYTGSDYSLSPLRSVYILYDTNATRWRLL
jgi:hypothetical protein